MHLPNLFARLQELKFLVSVESKSTFQSSLNLFELCDVAFDNLTEGMVPAITLIIMIFLNPCASLSILQLNIRSVHSHFDKLQNFLTSIPLQPDVIELPKTRIESEPLINI